MLKLSSILTLFSLILTLLARLPVGYLNLADGGDFFLRGAGRGDRRVRDTGNIAAPPRC